MAAACGNIDITPPNSAGNLERGEEGEAERGRTLALSFPSRFLRGDGEEERGALAVDEDDALVVAILLLRPPEALIGFGLGLK